MQMKNIACLSGHGRLCHWIGSLAAGPVVAFAALLAAPQPAVAGAGPSTCAWSDAFGGAGLGSIAEAMTVWDDGTGEALYVGGGFATADGQEVGFIARWDGTSWSPLVGPSGVGLDAPVWALAVYDDGNGPALYAGGQFSRAGGITARSIARWDGSTWSALAGSESGTEGTNGLVYALTVFDDGTGPVLVAGGTFTTAGGAPASRLAAWDGSSWSALGSGIGDSVGAAVHAMKVWDDGHGLALYVGGRFASAGGAQAHFVARWNGVAWSGLDGPGSDVIGGGVQALEIFDDGTGPALFAGGTFRTVDGVEVGPIARWDGRAWSGLPGATAWGPTSGVFSLAVHDDGSGPSLWLGGSFFGSGFFHLQRWDGASFAEPPAGRANSTIWTMQSWNDGDGAALYVGGSLTEVGGVGVSRVARLRAGGWNRLGSSPGQGMNSDVHAFAAYDDGTGRSLYAAGSFTLAGDVEAFRVARWTGSGWMPLLGADGGRFRGEVRALAVYDDGRGAALYAAGDYLDAEGAPVDRIVRWDGTAWSALDSANAIVGRVFALEVYDDGTGEALYAAGNFSDIGSQTVNYVARWEGSSWSPLGDGATVGTSSTAVALQSWDDGNGSALYVGGSFGSAGEVVVHNVARWDGSAWSALIGAGGTGVLGGVSAFEVFDDGRGNALYVGGLLLTAGGVLVDRIARWDGHDWSALVGSAGTGLSVLDVNAMTVFDDGAGPALYVGGEFHLAGGVLSPGLARWDGDEWSPVIGSGEPGFAPRTVYSVTTFDDGTGPAVWAGGDFAFAGGIPSSYVGKWSCSAPLTAVFVGLF